MIGQHRLFGFTSGIQDVLAEPVIESLREPVVHQRVNKSPQPGIGYFTLTMAVVDKSQPMLVEEPHLIPRMLAGAIQPLSAKQEFAGYLVSPDGWIGRDDLTQFPDQFRCEAFIGIKV